MEARPGAVKNRITIESWRICRPVVTDWHQFYEEVDPDPRQRVISRIRVRIKAKKPGSGPHDDPEHSS
jgi:hypothetical protein